MLLGQIFQSVQAWQKLSAIPLKPKVAYKILKYTRYISVEHEVAEKQRVALIHEVTNTKDGEDAKIEPGSSEFVEYATRFNEIMATEVKFDQIKLNLEDVVELLDDKPDALSVSDLATLEPFFQDCDDWIIDGEEYASKEDEPVASEACPEDGVYIKDCDSKQDACSECVQDE